MRLKQSTEQAEQWGTVGAVPKGRGDSGTIETHQTFTGSSVRTTRSATGEIVLGAAVVVGMRIFSQFVLGTATAYLMGWFLSNGSRMIPWWFSLGMLLMNLGLIVFVAWAVARIAGRRAVPALAYGSGIGYFFYLLYWAAAARWGHIPNGQEILPRMIMEGTFATVTTTVTEIALAIWFVRDREKKSGTLMR